MRSVLLPTLVLATLLLEGCHSSSADRPAPDLPAYFEHLPEEWDMLGQSRSARGEQGVIVTGHPIASRVGLEILEAGGTAVDAAVAAAFTLAVVHPEAGNLGGGGFAVIREATGQTHALDFRETAPAAATEDMYLDSAGLVTEASTVGHLASGVPGTVAGLAELHQRFGRLPWRRLLEPAIGLAGTGFELDEYRATSFHEERELLERFPGAREVFLPGGKPPEEGDTLRQSDLAVTLSALAEEGAPAFYRGRIADLLVAEMERGGGIITRSDLESYHPAWREPIRFRYRDHTIYSMPPSSSGGVTLAEILNILEGFEPLPPFLSAPYNHLWAESMRRAFWDRNRFLGDPDFVNMPLERLISQSYADSLREGIRRDTVTPTPLDLPRIRDGRSTTHLSVVDSEGTAVSLTTTINSLYGSGVLVRGAGFLLNNEMDDFTSAPGRPNQYGLIQGTANAIAPGKRMLSAMTPTIVVDPHGRLSMVLGSPGGPRIISGVAHVISNVLDHGMSMAHAVESPRMHHQALPDRIIYERNGLRPEVMEQLRRWGHDLRDRDLSGDVAAVIRTPDGWIGVADPRRGAGAAAY